MTEVQFQVALLPAIYRPVRLGAGPPMGTIPTDFNFFLSLFNCKGHIRLQNVLTAQLAKNNVS
jgi:hypothetical protein